LGFSRLNHLRFVAQDAMLTGILQVCELPRNAPSGDF